MIKGPFVMPWSTVTGRITHRPPEMQEITTRNRIRFRPPVEVDRKEIEDLDLSKVEKRILSWHWNQNG